MSFQGSLKTIKEKTGKDAADFRALAEQKGFTKNGELTAKAGDVTGWLKEEFELGHGHSMAIYTLLKGAKNEDSV